MSIFSSILNKLGFGDQASAQAATTAPATAPVATTQAAAPVAITQVDVHAKLEALAAAHNGALNWKTSIVDLLKLLDLDSSLTARKELAHELNCPANLLEDSASMNMWLHKTVLQQLAANGGNVPANLLS
jgi:hypothetical protein